MKTWYQYPRTRAAARQRGLTIEGLIITLVILGVISFVGLRLFPLYSEKWRVDGILETIAGAEDAEKLTSRDIHKRFLRNANIEGIVRFDKVSIKQHLVLNKPKKRTDPKTFTMIYELRGDMLGDIDVILSYNRTLELGGELE